MENLKKQKSILAILVIVIYLIFILYFSSVALTFTNFISHLVFLLILLFIYKDDLKANIKEFKKDKKRFITILLYFVIVFVLSSIIRSVIINLYVMATGAEQLIDSSNGAIYSLFEKVPWGTLFVCFLTIFFYPTVEELVFRKSLGDSLKSTGLFIVVSSLLSWYFQVTLLNPSINEFVLAIGVLLNSVFASIVYSKKKNILYTIFPRMIYNLIICILQFAYLFVK